MSGRKNGSGGVKGSLISGITIIILISVIVAWARANEITDLRSAYDYFKAWSDKASDVIEECIDGENLEIVCNTPVEDNREPIIDPDTGEITYPEDPDESSTPEAPLPVSIEEIIITPVDTMSTLLDSITISPPLEVDYTRSDWKHWTGKPCNTRIEVLKRDGVDVVEEDCKVLSGEWKDPYSTDVIIEDSSKIDIDHVIPLSFAAKNGANDWDKTKKEQFANDPTHLLAVSAKENRSKGDKGPGSYMPPNKEYHCEYSKIWIITLTKYDLSIEKKDARALEQGLETCTKD